MSCLLSDSSNNLLTTYPVVSGLPSNVQPLSSGLYTSMRPFAPPTPDKAIEATDKFHPVISGKQPLEFSSFLSRSIDRARKNVAGILSKKDFEPVEHADIGIIPLGTGGSVPSKYRNGAQLMQALCSSHSQYFISAINAYQDTWMGQYVTRYR